MLKIKSLKKTYLLGLTAVIILVLAVITSLLGIKNVASAEESEIISADDFKATTVISGFVYKDEATKKVISGFNLPDSVTDEFIIVIPDGVTAIENNVFANLEGLTGVTLNKELEAIGDYAFANTSLSAVNIPKSVTKIGEHAFDGCTALADAEFESGRTAALAISSFAFANCQSMLVLRLPDKTTVSPYAFDGCTSLLWVYLGNECRFLDPSDSNDQNVVFFPTNTSITLIFPSKTEYNKMLYWPEKSFRQKHSDASTYIIKVVFHIEGRNTPDTKERLYGQKFNYVPDPTSGVWNTDTAFDQLPVQDAAYLSTVWYNSPDFEAAVDYEGVNKLLKTPSVGTVNLYCHETISMPVFPTVPVSWVYSKDISYNIDNISEVLTALDCQQTFTEKQLQAFDVSIVFADENGKPTNTPNKINRSGVYSVSFSLKPEYGCWTQTAASSLTVSINTRNFTNLTIILLVVGAVAVVITVSTAIIRIKLQKRNKKKHLSQADILKKFKDIGGETDLK